MYEAVMRVIKQLKDSGFTAYIAGGAVRDLILGIPPKDFDVATDAKPEEIEKIFPNTRPVGKDFGVILVVENNKPIEVATFRSDANYSDSRRPDHVSWSSPKEDALRRDFTINALFLDLDLEKDLESRIEIQEISQEEDHLKATTNIGILLDYIGGLNDIEKKYLKFVGEAGERIAEDHLRIIRAIRFKAELNLHYFEDTFLILRDHATDIKTVSLERIAAELDKMFMSANRATAIKEMDDLGIFKILIPEIEPLKEIDQSKKFFQAGNIFDHTKLVVSHLPEKVDVDIVWASLLHDIGKPKTLSMGYDRKKRWTEKFHNHNVVGAEMAKVILKRLKFPNDRIERICWLVDNHQMPPQILKMREGRRVRWLLDPRLPDLLALHKADAQGKEKKVYLGWHDEVKKLMEEELLKPPPPPRLLDGYEIMEHFKIQPGPEIGRLLEIVEEAQWDKTIKTKEEAFKLVEANLKK
ncbi:MAG: Polynucleotide adenylyltransferase/metal dependent phosphohydrolase [Berkelbacteria bacterium GW2011_GWA2_38_9]|uniref:Polynucleotide adenylyltransferase/metal dependent phosphohydrolase n=1 Tax=Berkelbacteria bacterium GW2011_GWA2_38_9 TaxID=1618334 RepID=A0A0G0NWX9_9BACT|nr:MAG: Polynucleotide adenylyltransferase/metal dependent phosphohydrolase [Berkelbacteria bacterium GW2011_GWA2_38_9]